MNDVAFAIDELRASVARRDRRRDVVGFWLALTFVTLNGADVISTRRVLDTGVGHEGNPFMAWLLELGAIALLVKLAVPAVVGWRIRERLLWLLAGLCILLAVVVAWNVSLLVVR